MPGAMKPHGVQPVGPGLAPFAVPGVTPGLPLGSTPDTTLGVTPETAPAPSTIPPTPNPGGETVWMKSSEGNPVLAKIDQVGTLLHHGYTGLEPEHAHRLEAERKHNSAAERLKAFGQGAFEMAAPVVAPLVMEAAGRSMEEQRESAEQHPFLHGAGQVAGAIAPAIATMGASTPASAAAAGTGAVRAGLGVAARASAPEMINLAGQTAARAVEGIAGKSALSRITASAVNQATQGAAYAGADWANRVVQGDPRATAEQLFSQGAGAVIFGGGLGALGGAMTRVADRAVPDLLESLAYAEGRGGLKAQGATQKIIKDWEKKLGGPEKVLEMGRYLGREGAGVPLQSFEDKIEMAYERFKKPGIQKMEEILDSVTGQKKAYGFIDEVIDKIEAAPSVVAWSKDKLDKEGFAKFKGIMDGLRHDFALHDVDGNITAYTAISPKTLHDLSRSFANKARDFSGSGEVSRSALTMAMDKGRWLTNERLDQLLEDVSSRAGGTPGALSKAWKEAKQQYYSGLFLEEAATLGFNRSVGNNRVSSMEALGVMTGAVSGHAPGAAIGGGLIALLRREGSAIENTGARALGDFIRKMETQSGQKISDGIEKIFRAGTGRLSAEFAEAWGEHRITRETYPDTIRRLNRLAQDPEHAAQQVTTNFGPLVEGHGQVALALHDTASKVAANLSAALPAPRKNGPLDPDYTPSRSELAVLNRQWVIANEPTSVLHRIADGTYLEEDGKALAAMYPALTPKIKAAVADALAEKLASGEFIPAKARVGLSQFLGMELDSRATGLTIAAAQAAYAQQQQSQQAQKPPTKVDFKSSSQGMTDRQSTQARMDKA